MKYIIRSLFLHYGDEVEWPDGAILLGQGVALSSEGTVPVRGYEVVYLEPLIEEIDAIK